jgi:hypothetical protein
MRHTPPNRRYLSTMAKRITISSPPDLLIRARQKGGAERVVPRISTANGGPTPGIDLNDFAAL